jgi:hypothetical protein
MARGGEAVINEKGAVERLNRQRERIGAYCVPSVCASVPMVDGDWVTSNNEDAIDVLEHLVLDCELLTQYARDLLLLAREQ